MLSWRDFSGHLEHYKDLQREAERERRIEWLLGERKTRGHLHHRVFTSLGRYLATWGHHLQNRYGLAPGAPEHRAPNPRVVVPPKADPVVPMLGREWYETLTEPSDLLRICGPVGKADALQAKTCEISSEPVGHRIPASCQENLGFNKRIADRCQMTGCEEWPASQAELGVHAG